MRLSAIFLGLLLATGSAWAEWVKMVEADEATFYIDPSSITVDGDTRRAWTLTDKKQRDADGSMSARYREDSTANTGWLRSFLTVHTVKPWQVAKL